MLANTLILAVLLAGAPAQPVSYRIELKSGAYLIASDRPRDNGSLLLFHLAPAGPLTSLKKSEVARVLPVSTKTDPTVLLTLKPGGQVVLGPTGGSGAGATEGTAAPAAQSRAVLGGGPLGLGERKDGTALLNPNRAYRPEWDSTQVPGLNMPLPNSPNDYVEGLTIAYPPAPAVQSAPGQPPMMPPSTGDVPR
jgi:hypothetical protein